jgi:mono/diheme cytochrome c family protein
MKNMFIFMVGIWMVVISLGMRYAYGEEGLVEKGKQLYTQKKCGFCHTVDGSGGKKGGDLSDVSSKRDAEWLTKYLKDPKSLMPEAKMPAFRGTDEEVNALVAYLMSLKKAK